MNVKSLLAMSNQDVVDSGELGPQAKGVNHVELPPPPPQGTCPYLKGRASSCA